MVETSAPAAVCAMHPSNHALGACPRCGRFVCADCSVVFRGRPFCRGCRGRLDLGLRPHAAFTVMVVLVTPFVFALLTSLAEAAIHWSRAASLGVWLAGGCLPLTTLAILVRELVSERHHAHSRQADAALGLGLLGAVLESYLAGFVLLARLLGKPFF